MTRSELLAALAADRPHLNLAKLKKIVHTIFDGITDALARGDGVELRGFGAFTVRRRKARMGRNPKTGGATPVDEKGVLFFEASSELDGRLNGRKHQCASVRGAANARGPAELRAYRPASGQKSASGQQRRQSGTGPQQRLDRRA